MGGSESGVGSMAEPPRGKRANVGFLPTRRLEFHKGDISFQEEINIPIGK